MSFETYMVNRDESPAITFEGTWNNEYVGQQMREYIEEGFSIEPIGLVDVRIVFMVNEKDGRPWIYREFYAVEGDHS